jgi:hypothetical protein
MGMILFKDQLGNETVIDLTEVVAAKFNPNLKTITLFLKGMPKDSSFTITFPTLQEARNFWETEITSGIVVNVEVESIE